MILARPASPPEGERDRRVFDASKRCFDLVVSGLGLLATAPLQVVVAVLVWRSLGRPVLFQQERPGRNGEIFTLVKFRTMRAVNPAQGLNSDADRLVPFGAFLRATSMDELPTLWNVLRGEMSIVGPRPLLVSYLTRYNPRQARRHDVRPGLTGLAQVRGRNAVGWPERLGADVEYVETRSWRLDLSILARTARLVLRREGISAAGEATMSEFTGQNS